MRSGPWWYCKGESIPGSGDLKNRIMQDIDTFKRIIIGSLQAMVLILARVLHILHSYGIFGAVFGGDKYHLNLYSFMFGFAGSSL